MGATFIPSRCAHIDTVGSNVLIRGNMPLLGPDLHYALKEIQEASKIKDLHERRIIDIPIIDNVGERKEFVAIMKAFGVDPDKFPESFWPWWTQKGYDQNAIHGKTLTTEGLSQPGGVVWRPFEGLPKDENPKQFLGAPGWDYVGFLGMVIKLLKTVKNAAVYVHCQLGADRTGAFHIGYLMKTNGIGLAEASSAANGSTSAGAPNADYKRLVAAYAETL
jgi:hypothetical protein